MSQFGQAIADHADNFSEWYNDVVRKAELADYAPVRGCMIIRPYGYAIWENIQHDLDARFKATDVVNAYFPLLIPRSFLTREADHVEGFAPEVAWVTRGGGEELEEPLAIRPTSETIIGDSYAKWIQSYRDLPVLINQWNNVMRWEKVTRLFLRTTEFLWQEGHTAHATLDEAEERTRMMLEVYRAFVEDDLAMPVIVGRKTEKEKFAGALRTYSIEAMMGDGKALQAGTSHNLGQNFAKAFEIMFLDKDGERKFCATTSWGMSTRIIGGLIMVHGDKGGLIIPPRVAPFQAVIVPIWRKDAEKDAVMALAAQVEKTLKGGGVRVKVDRDETTTPGFKYNEWELRGVPLRIEIGPRDVANNAVVLVPRVAHVGEAKPTKTPTPVEGIVAAVTDALADIQKTLYARALAFRQENTFHLTDYAEFRDFFENRRGFVYAWHCGDNECEQAIKEDTKATIRNIPLDQPGDAESGTQVCIRDGKPSTYQVVFARAY